MFVCLPNGEPLQSACLVSTSFTVELASRVLKMHFFVRIVLVTFTLNCNFRLSFPWGIPEDFDATYGRDDSSSQLDSSNPISGETTSVKNPVSANFGDRVLKLAGHDRNALSEDDERVRSGYVAPKSNTYQSSNVSVDFIPGKESNINSTWKVEKLDKISSKEVFETQHATCQVTTEELVATAQATVTRVLKGLCNAKEMDRYFQHMEELMSNQLTIMKEMLLKIENRLENQEEMFVRGQKQLAAAIPKNCYNPDVSEIDRRSSKLQDVSSMKTKLVEVDEDYSSEEELQGIRDPEILKYNSSIHMEASFNGPSKKVFTYYWKVYQMHHKLTAWNPRKSLRSQSFYVYQRGYRMYLRIFPRQDEKNFYVHVGVTKGDFDDDLKWPFPLKHKVHILDQTKEGRTFEDIASRIWDPNQLCSEFNWQKPTKGDNYECVGLGFPHDVLRQRDYISQNTIIMKLTVYLDNL